MSKEFWETVGMGVLIIAGVAVVILALGVSIGLGIAAAKGTLGVPLGLRETFVVVLIGGGSVGAVAGAVAVASEVSKKRQSAFIALCSCGEWFIAEGIGELFLEDHALEKIIFKGCAVLAFALAGGLWSMRRVLHRSVAILLFIGPSIFLALKIVTSGIHIPFHDYRLYVLLTAPAVLAALYVTLFGLGILIEE